MDDLFHFSEHEGQHLAAACGQISAGGEFNVAITSAGKCPTDFLKVGRNMWKGDHFPCGQEHAVKKLRLSSMDIVSLERNIEEAARWEEGSRTKQIHKKT